MTVIRRRLLIAAALAAVAVAVFWVARFRRSRSAAAPERRGVIEFRMEQPGPLSAVSALFVDWSHAPGCSTRAFGVCRLETCALGGPAHFADAGVLTITGGSLPPTGVRMLPTSSGAYEPFVQQRALWHAGDMLHAQAAGGGVPGFQASVPVPPTVELARFAAPKAGAEWVVDRSRSLDFFWSNARAERIEIIVAAATRSPRAQVSKLICSVPAAARHLRISSAALGALPPVSGPPDTARLSVWASNVRALDTGGWSLSVAAEMPARAAGRVAAASITLR